MADYFISYNSADAELAWDLAELLESEGFTVKFDKWEVGLGADVAKWIVDALEDCTQLIGLFSPDYLSPAAKYSDFERRTMLWSDIAGHHKAAIPLKVRPCELPKVFATRAYFDLEKGSLEAFVAELKNDPSKGRPQRPAGTAASPKQTRFIMPDFPAQRIQGREADLARLREKLLSSEDVSIINDQQSKSVLKGQGGVGKTTLAQHYVETYGTEYDGALWCRAETETALIDSIYELYPYLTGQPTPEERSQAAARSLLQMLNERREKWLFVFDNAESYQAIRPLIPNAHLIVTTREAAGWEGFATLPTDVLPYDTEGAPAVRVLMEAAGREGDAAGARDLAEDLGGLPLALVVAGALIRAEGYAFAEYRSRIADVIAQVPRNAAYPDSVIGAVKLSYDRLPEDAQAVADLLAWWAPEGLTPDLLTGAPEGGNWAAVKGELSEEMIALVSDPARVRAAFQALVDASLLARAGRADEGHAMHRMTGAALRALQGEAPAATALLAAVYPGGENSPAFSPQWPFCRRLTPHVRALWETGAAPHNAAMDYLLNQAGIFLTNVGDPAGGLALAEARFELAEALHAPADPAYATALHNLGLARLRTDDRDGALRALRQAVDLRQTHRPGTEDLAVSLDQLGLVLGEMARAGQREHLPEAIKAVQRALALLIGLHGRRAAPVAASLNNLGAIRRTQRRGAAAARLVAASLSISRAVLPEGDARIAYGVVGGRAGGPGRAALARGAGDMARGLCGGAEAPASAHRGGVVDPLPTGARGGGRGAHDRGAQAVRGVRFRLGGAAGHRAAVSLHAPRLGHVAVIRGHAP